MAAAPAHPDGGLSLCLASAGVVKTLSIAAFTLVWTHSIEKVARARMPELVLGNSGAAGEWRLCDHGYCRTLSDIFGRPIGSNVTTMKACETP